MVPAKRELQCRRRLVEGADALSALRHLEGARPRALQSLREVRQRAEVQDLFVGAERKERRRQALPIHGQPVYPHFEEDAR